MPTFGPIKHQELISCLRKLGFKGPYSGYARADVIRPSMRFLRRTAVLRVEGDVADAARLSAGPC